MATISTTQSPLSLSGLRKSYGGTNVVDGISFTLQPGECYGLLGPNGAGKTTTLRLALGIIAPDAGEIKLSGLPVPAQARQARMRVGVVPQMDNLDPDFTVAENLLVYGRYFGLAASAVGARIPQLLEFAGLTGRADAKIQALSGGMKRRLTLARALVNDPDLLILDEPTTGLDPQARHLIWERLKQLSQQGKTVLITTHFMDEAERLCHRVAIMDNGRFVAEGTPRDMIAANIEPQVVEVFSSLTQAGGEEGAPAWARAQAPQFSSRIEVSGETVFCYLSDVHPLLQHLQGQPGLRFLHRPANLEDVFLKLTGRDLRD